MQNLIVLKLYYSLMKELNTEISVLLPSESDASNLKFKSNFGFFVELYSWNIEADCTCCAKSHIHSSKLVSFIKSVGMRKLRVFVRKCCEYQNRKKVIRYLIYTIL